MLFCVGCGKYNTGALKFKPGNAVCNLIAVLSIKLLARQVALLGRAGSPTVLLDDDNEDADAEEPIDDNEDCKSDELKEDDERKDDEDKDWREDEVPGLFVTR